MSLTASGQKEIAYKHQDFLNDSFHSFTTFLKEENSRSKKKEHLINSVFLVSIGGRTL